MIAETENEITRHFAAQLKNEDDDEIGFKSLKGIAGRRLDIDEVRRERLKLTELTVS
ncbi:MAG: hypothetical protein IJR27_07720 [Synergistaceae bacterium]|nr:hypothetical protein [Synergistaceae bacterium]